MLVDSVWGTIGRACCRGAVDEYTRTGERGSGGAGTGAGAGALGLVSWQGSIGHDGNGHGGGDGAVDSLAPNRIFAGTGAGA
jgi:hypothetical protein